jgi:DNA-binding MarR family transcriptional regulator
MTEPSDDATTAWARLLKAERLLLSAVERELKAAGLPPLGWYDALLELGRAPEGLRPYALEAELLLEQHNVSRLIDRMEKAGLVERRPCVEDGRGYRVALTAAGAETRARMWPVYRAAIARLVAAPLEPGEAASLARLLGRLIEAARG